MNVVDDEFDPRAGYEVGAGFEEGCNEMQGQLSASDVGRTDSPEEEESALDRLKSRGRKRKVAEPLSLSAPGDQTVTALESDSTNSATAACSP